ncbi:MAG: hypothetical protein WC437_04445 [Patescibacteria group bacterium]
MGKYQIKQFLKIQLKKLGYRVFSTVVLTLTVIATVWVYASFIEPAAAPNSSDQDFSQNILGANNADNDFDSSSVVANKDGSIIERAEYIVNRMTTQGEWYPTECADSTTTTKTNCYVDDTAKYVDTNACVNSANTGYCYMNTATFSAMDADLTAANILSGKTIFGVTGTAPKVFINPMHWQYTDSWIKAGDVRTPRCYCQHFGYSGSNDYATTPKVSSTYRAVYTDNCDWSFDINANFDAINILVCY